MAIGRPRIYDPAALTVATKLRNSDTLAAFEAIRRARGHQHRNHALQEAIDEYVLNHAGEAGLADQELLFDEAG